MSELPKRYVTVDGVSVLARGPFATSGDPRTWEVTEPDPRGGRKWVLAGYVHESAPPWAYARGLYRNHRERREALLAQVRERLLETKA